MWRSVGGIEAGVGDSSGAIAGVEVGVAHSCGVEVPKMPESPAYTRWLGSRDLT